jgi:5-deoxy-D-glucuronate isomerase
MNNLQKIKNKLEKEKIELIKEGNSDNRRNLQDIIRSLDRNDAKLELIKEILTNSEEISLCSSCNCMTKTIKNKCGKCKNDK